MLGESVAHSTSRSQDAATKKRQKWYKMRVKFLEIFVRYAWKHCRHFLNKKLCSDCLNCICTRSTQSPVAAPLGKYEPIDFFEKCRRFCVGHKRKIPVKLLNLFLPPNQHSTPPPTMADHVQNNVKNSNSTAQLGRLLCLKH